MFSFSSHLTLTEVYFHTVWIILLAGAIAHLGLSLFSSHSQAPVNQWDLNKLISMFDSLKNYSELIRSIECYCWFMRIYSELFHSLGFLFANFIFLSASNALLLSCFYQCCLLNPVHVILFGHEIQFLSISQVQSQCPILKWTMKTQCLYCLLMLCSTLECLQERCFDNRHLTDGLKEPSPLKLWLDTL